MDENKRSAAELLQKKILRDKKRKAKIAINGKGRPRGKPFAEGEDERRNVKGSRPRSAVLYRNMILDILAEDLDVTNPLTGKSETVSTAYQMARRMILGKVSGDHTEILNRGFGKVIDETRNVSEIDDFILANIDLFTDAQILRMQKGESRMLVLGEVLRSAVNQIKNKKKD